MDLTIVIPVLNEEGSVERVAENCLDARARIIAETNVDRVNVVVVSDGSTDRTVELAQAVAEVTTVVFEENQGYGAAIQRGWQERPAELLAFLDGDGTCDANFFVDLITAMHAEQADVALGSRLGKGSKMPRLRRFGNRIFALLLGLLSRQNITDSASGMRVVRKSSLLRLLPLPRGLHFTPAMSARAIIGNMKVVERPMVYAERVGQSKLSVVGDGFRFLGVILAAALYIRPSRISLPIVATLGFFSLIIGMFPSIHYLQNGFLLEWMIYRFLLISFLADVGVLVFCATLIAEHTIAVALLQYGSFVQTAPWWWGSKGLRIYIWIAALLVLGGAYLVMPGVRSYLSTGTISFDQMHWSRVILAAFSGLTFLQLVCTRLLIGLLDSLNTRQAFLLEDGAMNRP